MPTSGNPNDSEQRAKKAPDISKLVKLTPTKIRRTWRSSLTDGLAPDSQPTLLAGDKTDWKKLTGFSAIIFIVVFVLYAWSLNGGNVFNDSLNYNVLATAVSDSEFLASIINQSVLYPLTGPWTRLTYALDSISFPKQIPYFHLVNITLHAVACIYLYIFVVHIMRWLKADERTKFDPYVTGLIAALLLAVHPLATGAVAYISGRGPLLVACNYFLCLNLFLLGFNCESLLVLVGYYFLCLAFMAIGLLAGPLGMTIPLSITSLIFLLKPREATMSEWLKDRWIDLTLFALLGAGSFLTLLAGRPPVLDNGVDLKLLSPVAYVATQAKDLLTYFLRCFFVPVGLSLAPPMAVADGFSDPLAIAGVLVAAGMVASLWWLRKNTFLFFAMLLTILGLLPNFLVLQNEIVSDQRFYISVAGLCLFASWFVMTYLYPAQAKSEYARSITLDSYSKPALIATVAVGVLLAGLTLWRESTWLNPEAIWQQACNLNANDARAVGMLADAYRYSGKTDESNECSQKALKLDPGCPPAWSAKGGIQMGLRQYQPAQSYFQRAYDEAKARKTCQDKVSIYTLDLVDACAKNHDWKKVKMYAQEALVTRPNSPTLHVALGQAYVNENQPFPAMQELQKVSQIDPYNSDYLEPMADAAMQIGGRRYVEFALNTAFRAMQVKLSSHANVTFIRAALELGRVEAALTRLEKVLPREGTNAEALLCMSYAMHLLGEEKAAHMWEKKALEQDPKIKDKVKIKPVDKEAERPNDLGRASAKAKKPEAIFAPAGQTPSTAAPSTAAPSTAAPSTAAPSTAAPSTAAPSTAAPSTAAPSTAAPSTAAPSTAAPSTKTPSTP